MKIIKKEPIWIEKEKLQEVKDLLKKNNFPYWNRTGVLWFDFGTAVITSIPWIIILILIAK